MTGKEQILTDAVPARLQLSITTSNIDLGGKYLPTGTLEKWTPAAQSKIKKTKQKKMDFCLLRTSY